MTEDNENMDVDDILSSIKSILEEDEENRTANPTVSTESVEDSGDGLPDDTDDIIELSDDMRIVEENGQIDAEAREINQVEEGSPLGLAIDNLDNDNVKSPEPENPLVDVTDINVDNQVAEVEDTPREENFVAQESGEDVAKFDQVVDEPILEQESIETDEVVDGGTMASTDEPLIMEQEIQEEDSIDLQEDPKDDMENNVDISKEEATDNDEVMITESDDAIDSDDIKTESETTQTDNAVDEIGADNAVDVSANIISNFAKMFAKGNEQEKKKVSEMPQIIGLGQGSKTLEDFVKDAVVKVIGDDISKKWNNGADYYNMAEMEIKRQVKDWINDNLPIMIERIVKEEIARVIEKVGS